MVRRFSLIAFVIVVAALLLVSSGGSGVYTNWLWFKSLGYTSVFLTVLYSRLAVGLAVTIAVAAFVFANLAFTRRSLRGVDAERLGPPLDRWLTPRRITLALALVGLVLGALIGWGSSGNWIVVQSFLQRTPFNVADPLFSKDVAFYVFSLPFYSFLYQIATFGIVVSFLAAGLLYAVSGAVSTAFGRLSVARGAKIHLSILAALFFALKAVGYRLDAYRLLYSPRGVTFGAGYTDVHANLPGLQILTVLALIGAALVVVGAFRRGLRLFAVAAGTLIVASFILGAAYPALVQQFSVSPNELAKERPYIKHNIEMTRAAYALDRIEEKPFHVTDGLAPEDLAEHRGTLDNVRVWDYRPLEETYAQLQEIRLYYSFSGVDVDRYVVNGRLRQVLLSAREMNREKLPEQAQTWTNRYLKFTHGYGIVMSPSNEFTPEGLPRLWIKDIPPVSTVDFEVTRPEIYYGQLTEDYVVVNTAEAEFDYPVGDTNAYTHYEGTGGVPVGSLGNRIAFAFRLGSYRVLFTGAIKPDSRVMINRDIKTRVRTIAPFLLYDADPYLVLQDGRLFWIQDAYTASNRYPYSEPYKGRLNYVRNSVKVVIDAYNGDVTYYVVEPGDPLVATYRKIFPDLFRPFEDMPDGLRDHVRYPEDLFTIQAEMYATYHMEDPDVFYNREDTWRLPTEIFEEREQQVEPYYVIMRLPDGEEIEFVLIVPFTPSGKRNMIAWLAARSDEEHYGDLIVYKFPKKQLIYGPMQIEARINQDPNISQLLTLWGQRGSSVIRGNLLVIPIEDSLLYVEPLYLQATESRLPELKRIIVAYSGRVAMEVDLQSALRRIFGIEEVAPGAEERPEDQDGLGTLDVRELVEEAATLFEQAQQRARQGDWSGYGDALRRLQETLEELRARTGATPGQQPPEAGEGAGAEGTTTSGP